MQVEIQLLGKANHWTYQQSRIRIGRDSSCDISLPSTEYPMVSREHVVLEFNKGALSLSDPRSGNGTYLRGERVTSATLSSGDTIRLGVDGPELLIFLSEAAAQTMLAIPIEQSQTRISDVAAKVEQPAATRLRSAVAGANSPVSGDSPTVVRSSATGVGASADRRAESAALPQPTYQPSSIRIGMGKDEEAVPQPKVAEPATISKNSGVGDQYMIDQKLSGIRTLLILNLGVLCLLLLGLLYENQQIERNRKALMELRSQAQSAVGQFQPELDTRLNSFEKRMDSLDGMMKDEEDHFVRRMNTEIPAMLDNYIARKLTEAKRQAATSRF